MGVTFFLQEHSFFAYLRKHIYHSTTVLKLKKFLVKTQMYTNTRLLQKLCQPIAQCSAAVYLYRNRFDHPYYIPITFPSRRRAGGMYRRMTTMCPLSYISKSVLLDWIFLGSLSYSSTSRSL